MFIIKLYLNMFRASLFPSSREYSVYNRIWCSALVVMAVALWSRDARCMQCEVYCSTNYQCKTPYAAVHTIVLLMLGTMMPSRTLNFTSAYSFHTSSTETQPPLPMQNTICGNAHYCSLDDGNNDARRI